MRISSSSNPWNATAWTKPPGDHRSEAREARLLDVGGGDVPARRRRGPRRRPSPCTATRWTAPAPSRDRTRSACAIRARLDLPSVRRDGDEAALAAVVPKPLDELPLGLRALLGDRRMRHPRVHDGGELPARPEPPPARRAHANDRCRGSPGGPRAPCTAPYWSALRADPHLMPDGTTDRGEPLRIRRAVLAALSSGAPATGAPSRSTRHTSASGLRRRAVHRSSSAWRLAPASDGVAPSIRQSSAMSSSPSTGSIRVVARPPASRPLTRR